MGRHGPCQHANACRNKTHGEGDGGGGNATLENRYKCFTEAVAAVSWGSYPGSDTALLQHSQIYPVQKSNPTADSHLTPAPRAQQQALRLAKMTMQDSTLSSKAFRGPQSWTRTSRERDPAKHPAHQPSSKIIFKLLLKYFWVFLFPC